MPKLYIHLSKFSISASDTIFVSFLVTSFQEIFTSQQVNYDLSPVQQDCLIHKLTCSLFFSDRFLSGFSKPAFKYADLYPVRKRYDDIKDVISSFPQTESVFFLYCVHLSQNSYWESVDTPCFILLRSFNSVGKFAFLQI